MPPQKAHFPIALAIPRPTTGPANLAKNSYLASTTTIAPTRTRIRYTSANTHKSTTDVGTNLDEYKNRSKRSTPELALLCTLNADLANRGTTFDSFLDRVSFGIAIGLVVTTTHSNPLLWQTLYYSWLTSLLPIQYSSHLIADHCDCTTVTSYNPAYLHVTSHDQQQNPAISRNAFFLSKASKT